MRDLSPDMTFAYSSIPKQMFRTFTDIMSLESEVEEILIHPAEDRPGKGGSRVALGRTSSGRFLRVVYVPDPEQNSIFVITAYELKGKPLTAFQRRHRRKPR